MNEEQKQRIDYLDRLIATLQISERRLQDMAHDPDTSSEFRSLAARDLALLLVQMREMVTEIWKLDHSTET